MKAKIHKIQKKIWLLSRNTLESIKKLVERPKTKDPLVLLDGSCTWSAFEGWQFLLCQLFVDAVLFIPRECGELFNRRNRVEGFWRRLASLFGRSAAINVDVGQRIRFDGFNPLRQSGIEARKCVVDLDSRRPLH